MSMIRALCVVVLLSACETKPSSNLQRRATTNHDRRTHLRDDVRLLLEAQCGTCHIGNYETAIPEALAVYDLSLLEWSAKMSTAQLEEALLQVDVRLPEGEGQVGAEELSAFRAFIEEERRYRGL